MCVGGWDLRFWVGFERSDSLEVGVVIEKEMGEVTVFYVVHSVD